MKRVVELVQDGRTYRFYVDEDPPLAYWRVEGDGRPAWARSLCVLGNEQPDFFRDLARQFDEARHPA